MRTPQQQRAIDARGTNLLVSAAAGAGKTTVLVDRILSMIRDDGIRLSQMLIVTFTRDAANVMRRRLAQRLEEAAAEETGERAAFFARELDSLSDADISTMDTFCQKFLRRHFAAADIPADFRIADDQTMQSLRRSAAQELLEEQYLENTTAFRTIAKSYGTTGGDSDLIDLLLKVYDYSRNQSDPRAFLLRALEMYDAWQPKDRNHPWNRACLRRISDEYMVLGKKLKQLEREAARYDETQDCCACLCDDAACVAARLSALSDDPAAIAAAPSFGTWPRKTKKMNLTDVQSANRDRIKDARAAINSKMKKTDTSVLRLFSEEAAQTMERARDTVREVVRLVTLLDAKLFEMMKTSGRVDFSALEHCTIAALENGAAQAAREKYRAIFFDEYQDANRVQERIVQLIAGEGNLFFVGDVKQSIYHFRSADPTLFLEKFNEWGAGRGGERIDLNRNFRSMCGVLDAVNSVFFRIMDDEAESGGIRYDETQALYAGSETQNGGAAAQLHILDEPAADAETSGEDALAELRKNEVQARYVASLVRDLLEEGTLTDRNTGNVRRVEKNDIAILLRAPRGAAEDYVYALEREGIDCVAQADSRHFDTIEVRALLDVLSVIDNPYQDVPLIGALRSPLFLFELDDLARIRIFAPRARAPFFCDALRQYAENGTDDTAKMCREALEKIEHWRLLSHALPLDELLEGIMADTNYEDLLSVSPVGMQKLVNIRFLLSRVRELQASTFDGIPQFLDYVRRVREGSDVGEAPSNLAADAVQILSIHKSKGLEYPIVILPRLEKQFYQDTKTKVFLDAELGAAVKETGASPEKSVAQTAISYSQTAQERAEEMRILYVGMTRACDRLLMVGMKKGGVASYEDEPVVRANCFLDWVAPAALSENEARKKTGQSELWKIVPAVLSQKTRQTKEKEAPKAALAVDRALYERIDKVFSWQYPYREDTQALSKTTVTALKLYAQQEQEDALKVDLPLPKRPQAYTPSVGIRRGTATHLAVQHLDFSRAQSLCGVTRQIDQLETMRYLTHEDRVLIDDNDVYALCESELGARLADAQKRGALYRETPFTFAPKEGGETLVQGAIDVWFYRPDGQIVLIDYKTDSAGPGGAEALLAHYRRQLEWYRAALEKLTGSRVAEVFLYSFSCAKWARLEDTAKE